MSAFQIIYLIMLGILAILFVLNTVPCIGNRVKRFIYRKDIQHAIESQKTKKEIDIQLWKLKIAHSPSQIEHCPSDIYKEINPKLSKAKEIGIFDN